METTIGDGIVAAAIVAGVIAYLYFKFRAKQIRLEILHAERVAAMEKGIPLPELPLDEPPAPPKKPAGPDVPLILGILLFALGAGTMIALGLIPSDPDHRFWPLPLPLALMGLGLILYYFLAGRTR